MLPLHLAMRYGSSDQVVDLLLNCYPDAINVEGKMNRTPLECALRGEDKIRGRILRVFVECSRAKASKSTVAQSAREVMLLKKELRCKEQELVTVREKLSVLDESIVKAQSKLTHKIEKLKTIQNKVYEKTNQKIVELGACKQQEEQLLQAQIERLRVEERELREVAKQKAVEEADLVEGLETVKSNQTHGTQLSSSLSGGSRQRNIEPEANVKSASLPTDAHKKEGASMKEIKLKRDPTNECFSSTPQLQSENRLVSKHKDNPMHDADVTHSAQSLVIEVIQEKSNDNKIDFKSELSRAASAKIVEPDRGDSTASIARDIRDDTDCKEAALHAFTEGLKVHADKKMKVSQQEIDLKRQNTDPAPGSIRSKLSSLLAARAVVESKHTIEVDKLKARLTVFLHNSSKTIETLEKAKLAEERGLEGQIKELKAEERELETDEAIKEIELRVLQSLQDEPDSFCSVESQSTDIPAQSDAKSQIDNALKIIEKRFSRSRSENAVNMTTSLPPSGGSVSSNTNTKATSDFVTSETKSKDEVSTVEKAPKKIDAIWDKSLLSMNTNVSTDTVQNHPLPMDDNHDRTLLARALCMTDRLAAPALKNDNLVAARALSDDVETNGTCGVNPFKTYVSLWRSEAPFTSFLPSDNSIIESSSDTACEKTKSAEDTSNTTDEYPQHNDDDCLEPAQRQQQNEDDFLNPDDLNPVEAVAGWSGERDEQLVVQFGFHDEAKDKALTTAAQMSDTAETQAIEESPSLKDTQQRPEHEDEGDDSNPDAERGVVTNMPNVNAFNETSHFEGTADGTVRVADSQQKPEEYGIELSHDKETSAVSSGVESTKEIHHDDDVRLRSDHGDEPIAPHSQKDFNIRVNSAPTQGTASRLAQDDGVKQELNKTSSMSRVFDIYSSSIKPVEGNEKPAQNLAPRSVASSGELQETNSTHQDTPSHTIDILAEAHGVCAAIDNETSKSGRHLFGDIVERKSYSNVEQTKAVSLKATESEMGPDEKINVIDSKLGGQSAASAAAVVEDCNLNVISATESNDRGSIDCLTEEAFKRCNSAEQHTKYELTRDESVELELISEQVKLTPSPDDTAKAAATDKHNAAQTDTNKAVHETQEGGQMEQPLNKRTPGSRKSCFTKNSTSKRPPLFKRPHSNGRSRIKALNCIAKIRNALDQPTLPTHIDLLETTVKPRKAETSCSRQDEVEMKLVAEQRDVSSTRHSTAVAERKMAEQKDVSSFAAIVERTKASLGHLSDSSSSREDSIMLQVDQILSMISNTQISQARVESDLSDSDEPCVERSQPDEDETRQDESLPVVAAPPIVITFSGQGSENGPTTIIQNINNSDQCSREEDIEIQFATSAEPSTTSHQSDKKKTRWQKYAKKLFRNKQHKEDQKQTTMRKKATVGSERLVGPPLSSSLGG
jgi:hypothetical protein